MSYLARDRVYPSPLEMLLRIGVVLINEGNIYMILFAISAPKKLLIKPRSLKTTETSDTVESSPMVHLSLKYQFNSENHYLHV